MRVVKVTPMILEIVWKPLWFILPAWAGNMLACTFGGGRPIDGGRTFIDGRPLLGKGKTVRGFCVGVSSAVSVAVVQSFVLYTFNPLIFGLLMGIGAMLGDMTKSFFKRRFNVDSGKPLPLFDQLDFVVGSLGMYYVFGPLLFEPFYSLSWEAVLVIAVVTPLMHLLFNSIGYLLGMKEVWW